MDQITEIAALRAWRHDARQRGLRVALVPTMGALHEGHLTLVDAARRVADRVVMSIFVNPLQFAAGEDLERYPRNLPHDAALAEGRGVDLIFAPEVAAIYPPGSDTRVVPGVIASRWEGAVRPGHFDGVLTVVAKLLHLVEPTVAVFGQKDIQQVTLLRQMVRDLDFPVGLVVVPIAREPDGLARSSRNVYLDAKQRQDALALRQGLLRVQGAYQAGGRRAEKLMALAQQALDSTGRVVTDYIAITDPDQLGPVSEVTQGSVVAVAARVGTTRLIDNIILGEEGV